MDDSWAYTTIEQTKCISWTNIPQSSSQKRRRSKQKQEVGMLNKEILMVDKRHEGSHLVLCDIVFVTDRSNDWFDECKIFYSQRGYNVEEKSEPYSTQLVISKTSSYVSISFFKSHQKVMVQPGDRDERNLLQWISDFNELKVRMDDIERYEDAREVQDDRDPLDEEMGQIDYDVNLNNDDTLLGSWDVEMMSQNDAAVTRNSGDAAVNQNSDIVLENQMNAVSENEDDDDVTLPKWVACDNNSGSNNPADGVTDEDVTLLKTVAAVRFDPDINTNFADRADADEVTTIATARNDDVIHCLRDEILSLQEITSSQKSHIKILENIMISMDERNEENGHAIQNLKNEILSLQEIIVGQKSHLKILQNNLISKDEDISLLEKAVREGNSMIEKVKKESKKACNKRDAMAKEKVNLTRSIQKLEAEISYLKTRPNSHIRPEAIQPDLNESLSDDSEIDEVQSHMRYKHQPGEASALQGDAGKGGTGDSSSQEFRKISTIYTTNRRKVSPARHSRVSVLTDVPEIGREGNEVRDKIDVPKADKGGNKQRSKINVVLSGDGCVRGIGKHLQDDDVSGLAMVHREAVISDGKRYMKSDIEMLDAHTDSVFVASYGSNDILDTNIAPLWKLESMICSLESLLRVKKYKVGLLQIPPVKNGITNGLITEANKYLKERCANSGISFLDANLKAQDVHGYRGLSVSGTSKMAKTVLNFAKCR